MSVYTRQRKASGVWRYHSIREGKGQKTGDLSGPFYARPRLKGKQVWKTLSATTFKGAKEEAAHLALALDAQAQGLTVAEADAITNSNRVPVRTAVNIYLDQKSTKARRTVMAYRLVLNEFVDSLDGKIRFLDEIDQAVLRTYKKFMEKQGYAGKTIDSRLNIVFFLLKKNGISARIPRDEMPTIEEQAAVPYSEEDLKSIFAAMSPEEVIRYKFFLGTACLEQEVTFATWQDIDFTKRTYTIRRKEDVGFTPKNHESRTVPMPTSLVALLKDRYRNRPHDRWIFVNQDGKPEGHFLRKLKTIAWRANLNCGQCKTTITKSRYEKQRVEVTCTTAPVCEHWILHRLRKTCATRWVENGVPVRTIQHWLAHKSLETTMLYLGITNTEKLRDNVDRAFGD